MKNSFSNEICRSSFQKEPTASFTEILSNASVHREENLDNNREACNDGHRNRWNRRGILLSFLSCLIADLNFSMILTFYPDYAIKMGLNPLEIGVIFALFQTSNFCFSFLSPNIIDRFGGYRVLLTSNLLNSIVTPFMCFTVIPKKKTAFLATGSSIRIAQGILASLAETSSTSIIRESTPENASLDVLAWGELFRMVGIALGPIVGAIFYRSFGYDSSFIFSSTLFLALALGMFLFPITEKRSIESITRDDLNVLSSASDRFPISKYVKRPLVITVSILISIISASITYLEPILQLFLSEPPRNVGNISIGLIYSVYILSFLITLPTLQQCHKCAGTYESLFPGIFCLGTGYLTLSPPKHFTGPLSLFAFLHSNNQQVNIFFFSILGITSVGFGVGICQAPIIEIMLAEAEILSLSQAEITEYVPKVIHFAFTAGTALGPFLGGLSVYFIEFQRACAAFGYAILLSGAIILIVIQRLYKRREVENDEESVSDLASPLLQPNNRIHEPSGF